MKKFISLKKVAAVGCLLLLCVNSFAGTEETVENTVKPAASVLPSAPMMPAVPSPQFPAAPSVTPQAAPEPIVPAMPSASVPDALSAPAAPDMPAVPAPQFPAAPSVTPQSAPETTVPAMPSVSIPAAPSAPAAPDMPAVPAPQFPAAPNVTPQAAPETTIPTMPSVSIPAAPSAPAAPDMPAVPAPQFPAAPSVTPQAATPAPAKESDADKPIVADVKVGDSVQPPYIEDKMIKIATGAVGGLYYPAGESVCRVINRGRKDNNLRCDAEPTPGSVYNLKALDKAEVAFALVQSDWQKKIYNGDDEKDGLSVMNDLRFMFSLYNESLTMVVKKNSPIWSLNDIVNKSVNFGPEGSGSRAMMTMINGIKGWSNKSFSTVAAIELNAQPDALCNGDIDVMVMVAGHPNNMVQRVSDMCEIRIIDLSSDQDVQKLLRGNAAYISATIDAGIYSGVAQAVQTFGVKATMVTTSEISDDVVYKITKDVFSNLSYFKKLNPVFKDLSIEKMIAEGQTAPMHAGAAKYFREAGYIK